MAFLFSPPKMHFDNSTRATRIERDENETNFEFSPPENFYYIKSMRVISFYKKEILLNCSSISKKAKFQSKEALLMHFFKQARK